jgi:peptidoglycan/LPS O-acetylase OafA/YrhL
MEGVVVGLLVVAAVLSRPIEARLWRAGRLSDRTTTILLLGRFPVICFVGSLISGAAWPLVVGITMLGLLPSALFYRFVLDLLREQSRERSRAG